MDDTTVIDWHGIRALGITYARTHIYRLMREGKFPQCFSLSDSPRSRVVWWLSEVKAWLQQRASRRTVHRAGLPTERHPD
jgi:predicted DNA-binding transcriptional regulator AlpA